MSNKKLTKTYPLPIPVKPHLFQYLDFHFGNHSKFSLRTWLGAEIFSILNRPLNNGSNYTKEAHEYNQQFTIHVNKTYYFHFRMNSFTPMQIALINRIVQEHFNDRMLDYVMTLSEEGVTHKEAILRWCQRYNLDEGSTDWYQTLGRTVRRKKPIWEEKLSKNSVINCPLN